MGDLSPKELLGSGKTSHAIGKPNQQIMAEALKAEAESARSMMGISEELWGLGEDIRPQLQQAYEASAAGGFTGEGSPLYQAIAPHAGGQFDIAARNITEAGGPASLIEDGRSKTLSDLMAKAAMDDYTKAFGLAFGQPGTALMGHQGAGSIFGNVAGMGAQAQQNFAGTMQGVGYGLGQMLGGGGGGGQPLSGPSYTTDAYGRQVLVA